MINWSEPLQLEGTHVKLIPLTIKHRDALLQAASDGKLWELWFTSVPSEINIDKYIADALQQKKDKKSIPFVVIDKKSNSVIGSTRYCNIENENKRLEIGYTWYAQSFQRTGVNTECKYLLLRNAFENFEAIAVEFRTHWFNEKSRNAILRLGAKQDGVLRNHRIDKDGGYRDTVVFSILNSEWPIVKKSLIFKMNKFKNRSKS